MYRDSQSLSYLYNLCAGHYQLYDEFKTIYPYSCVETKWPGSRFTMPVLGCRSLALVNNQVLNKIKIAVRILLRKGHKHDEI